MQLNAEKRCNSAAHLVSYLASSWRTITQFRLAAVIGDSFSRGPASIYHEADCQYGATMVDDETSRPKYMYVLAVIAGVTAFAVSSMVNSMLVDLLPLPPFVTDVLLLASFVLVAWLLAKLWPQQQSK